MVDVRTTHRDCVCGIAARTAPLVACLAALAAASAGNVLAADKMSPLPEHYVLGSVRVFYAVDGDAAVPASDGDSSGVPDHVEDVAKQIWAAHRLFCEVLKFPDPLKSERYPGVRCIEVRIRDPKEIGGHNGVAFDESQRAKRIPEGKPDDHAGDPDRTRRAGRRCVQGTRL